MITEVAQRDFYPAEVPTQRVTKQLPPTRRGFDRFKSAWSFIFFIHQ